MTKPRSVAATANNNSIPGSRIENGTITQDKFGSSVSFPIEDGSITTDKLEDGAVTQDKISPDVAFPPSVGSVEDITVASDAAISASKLSFSPSYAPAPRSVEEKLEEFVSVKDFGAVGDYDPSTGTGTVNTDAFEAALAYVRSAGEGATLFIPRGRYLINRPLTPGSGVSIVGEGVAASWIYAGPEGIDAGYMFNFTSNGGERKTIRDFSFYGPVNYSTRASFFYAAQGYQYQFERLNISRVNHGIYCNNGYYSTVRNCRFTFFLGTGVRIDLANGSSIRDCNFQAFAGTGIRIFRGLSTLIDNVVLEQGISATGIRMAATQSARVNNVYTEGAMNVDIALDFAAGRSCVDTILSGLWLNSGALRPINAQSIKGLLIDGAVVNTPPAGASLVGFDSENYSQRLIYVNNITQVDQNAGNFLFDRRGDNQPLIPITSSSNNIVYTVRPQPTVGNGTDADVSNISNHTAKDSNGLMPRLYRTPTVSTGSDPTVLSSTSSNILGAFGGDSSPIKIHSKDYGSVLLTLFGNMSNSTGSTFCSSKFRIKNLTTGDEITSSDQNFGPTPTDGEARGYINLAPGINEIVIAISREQGGAGTNTFTVQDLWVS